MTTPEAWRVPRGHQPYLVRTLDAEGTRRMLLLDTDPDEPNQIRDTVFALAPETVDYTFKAVDRGYVHRIGRIRAQREFIGRTMRLAFAYEQERTLQ